MLDIACECMLIHENVRECMNIFESLGECTRTQAYACQCMQKNENAQALALECMKMHANLIEYNACTA